MVSVDECRPREADVLYLLHMPIRQQVLTLQTFTLHEEEDMKPRSRQVKRTPEPEELLPVFREMMNGELVRQWLSSVSQRFYNRIWPPLVTLWAVLYQRLNPDHTCDAVVSAFRSGVGDGLDTSHAEPLSRRMKSESPTAYGKARQRLPLTLFDEALRYTSQVVRDWMGVGGTWLGHPVGLLDGTTFLARPWEGLVKKYGRHKNQHGETYWVVMRAVGVFCAFTGCLLAVADGSLHASEAALASQLLVGSLPGMVWVGDRNFGIYRVVQAARQGRAEVLLRLTDPRARALARRDVKVGEDIGLWWCRSPHDTVNFGMPRTPVQGRLLRVRVGQNGFRIQDLYLFTTLLDAQRYPVDKLVQLYGVRWHVELNLRYVKATLQMGQLTARSVDNVRKELRGGLLGYNVIRGFMAQAARRRNLSPLDLSFTRCWRRIRDTLIVWRVRRLQGPMDKELERLLDRLAQCRLRKRKPFRIEPRAVRRKPMVYENLKGSRAEARQRVLKAYRRKVR